MAKQLSNTHTHTQEAICKKNHPLTIVIMKSLNARRSHTSLALAHLYISHVMTFNAESKMIACLSIAKKIKLFKHFFFLEIQK